jgi:transposase
MDIHKNARLTVYGRERIVPLLASGETVKATAAIVGVSENTVRKWQRRYRAEGLAGLRNRSSTGTDSPDRLASAKYAGSSLA